MQQLYINDNMLTGSLPGGWQQLQNITDIWLGNNKLSGSLFSWSSLSHLQAFNMSSNAFTGTLGNPNSHVPAWIGYAGSGVHVQWGMSLDHPASQHCMPPGCRHTTKLGHGIRTIALQNNNLTGEWQTFRKPDVLPYRCKLVMSWRGCSH